MVFDDGGLARSRAHNFTAPWGKLFQMLLFGAVVSVLVASVYPVIEEAFLANVYINSVIVAVLALGALYALAQVVKVFEAAGWLRRFLGAGRHADPGNPPDALSPMAELLSQTPGEMRLSAVAARSMLDSVGMRMSEAGEITRYLSRLLIFLGLLGTFWGLLETLGGVVSIVNELAAATGGNGDVAVLFERLREPLQGMGVAFSSSILGIAGSLILGFLDLQASQAQARFYNEVEDWLAKISRVGIPNAAGSASGSPAYVNAMLEQMAESLDALQSVIRRAEESRVRANEALSFLSTELSSLNDRLARQEDALVAIKDKALDDTMMRHARNMDASLQRLVNEAVVEREQSFQELRNELRAMTKAIASAVGDQK